MKYQETYNIQITACLEEDWSAEDIGINKGMDEDEIQSILDRHIEGLFNGMDTDVAIS